MIGMLFFVVLLASACSSSKQSNSGPTGSSAPTGAISAATGTTSSGGGGSAATGTPIKIGAIGSYSGANSSSESGAERSIKVWAKWINDNGGINGHPVDLTVVDDGGTASAAATGVHKLIEQDHVVAIVGAVSNLDVTWAPIADKAGVPVVGGLSLDLPYDTDPNFYPSGANQVAMIYGALTSGKKYGTKFGDIYCAESPVCAAGGTFYAAVGAPLGMTVPVRAAAAASAPSYTAQCQALVSNGVDAYTLSVSGAIVVKISNECIKQGVKATLVLTDAVVTPDLLTAPGTQNVVASELVAPFFDDSVPGVKIYRDALQKYDPSILNTNEDNPAAIYAWAGGQLFAAAAKASGASDITSQTIKDGLYKLKDETLDGIAPPLNFTVGTPAHINCTFTIAIQNGKYTSPDGVKPTSCVPDVLVTKLLSK